MKKRAIILGSTGSIGRSTIDVLAGLAEEWEVVGLGAGSRSSALAKQANRLRPAAIALADPNAADDLRTGLAYSPDILTGENALEKLVTDVDCDCVISAVVGAAGLAATFRAVECGRTVALANKEAMVVAGSLLMPLAVQTGATIIPIDSEHAAIFQAMRSGEHAEVRKVYLTASGGPFRTYTQEEMETVSVEDALNHPTWKMGPKITIDSATMMNKALEIVEARWLFDLREEQIGVVIHPESILHALVEFCDGSLIAQLSAPDMRMPIQYALTYPRRLPGCGQRLNLFEVGQLTLAAPDAERFPALRLGYEVARRGGTLGAVFNGANEASVQLFRDGAIGFGDIARQTERVMREHELITTPTLADLMAADKWARQEVNRCTTC